LPVAAFPPVFPTAFLAGFFDATCFMSVPR
jgi:hypothetical protein